MTEKRGKNSPKDESNTTICTYQNEACFFYRYLITNTYIHYYKGGSINYVFTYKSHEMV